MYVHTFTGYSSACDCVGYHQLDLGERSLKGVLLSMRKPSLGHNIGCHAANLLVVTKDGLKEVSQNHSSPSRNWHFGEPS